MMKIKKNGSQQEGDLRMWSEYFHTLTVDI